MATTLRDFIAQRETEIRDQQKALKAELRELQIAKAALEQGDTANANGGGSMTIKDMAREVLSAMPEGLTSSGILEGIKKGYGREIERTSLSPQLSRLKDDGELKLDGEVWYLSQHFAALQERTWGAAGAALTQRAAEMPEIQPLRSIQRTPVIPPMPASSGYSSDYDEDVPF